MTSIADPGQLAAPRPLARPFIGLGRRILAATLQRLERGRLDLVDGDGVTTYGDPAASTVVLEVLDPSVYAAIGLGGSIGAAEAYMDGLWRCSDLAGLVELLASNEEALSAVEGPMTRWLVEPLSRVGYWLQRNTRSGSRSNIRAHYDLGDDFFGLFLDPTMTYSCGIFENGARTLEQAQVEKIDRACRKLELTAGDHLLEVGTGWGALAIHAARNYGCRVTTTTISPRQHAFASRRVADAGLSGQIEVLQRDYRDLDGQYDKLVSVEMIEAVGQRFLPTFFEACSRLLKPEGMMLLQAIVIRDQHFEEAARTRDFLKKYIFPGSCLPSVSAMTDAILRRTDLGVFHLEEIGLHYADTLAQWRRQFFANEDKVRQLGFDDRFVRMWEFYLCYCEGTFRARRAGTVQMLLTKPLARRAPLGAGVGVARGGAA